MTTELANVLSYIEATAIATPRIDIACALRSLALDLKYGKHDSAAQPAPASADKIKSDTIMVWRGYTIEPKRDWSESERKQGRSGYVVTKYGCNAMPGAYWFNSIAHAQQGIACLLIAKEIKPGVETAYLGSLFYLLMDVTRENRT